MDKPQGATALPRSLREYYVAVGTEVQKLSTLLELLTALRLQATHKLSTVVVSSSRDVLDSIVSALQDNTMFAVCGLHSDLTDKEREFQVSHFQRQLAAPDAGEDGRKGSDTSGPAGPGQRAPEGVVAGGSDVSSSPSLVLVTTDVCLRAVPKELQPLGVSLLIQYDLPTKKDQLMKRISTVFGGGRERRVNQSPSCVIDFVVGSGQAELFRAVERFASTPILEMPVHVGEMFV